MRVIFLAFLVLLNTEVSSATLSDKDEAKNLAASVMLKINEGKLLNGFELIKPYIMFSEKKFNEIRTEIIKQEPIIKKYYGETLGFELIKTTEIGESLMLLEYIQKYEKHLAYWQFYFYRPNDRWVLSVLKFDDEIKNIFNKE